MCKAGIIHSWDSPLFYNILRQTANAVTEDYTAFALFWGYWKAEDVGAPVTPVHKLPILVAELSTIEPQCKLDHLLH